ncbi:lipopolysaccharide biosynthesis protein [Pontibacter saemangeumensis]|uniref:Lipopolysaccharide biosynthesis protein n=1 Tax=Pontibacter saemangeumensis TaxID=1084525 RepID=A0ABP8LG38_9BACT
MTSTLKSKVLSATKWSILSEIVSKTITPLVFLTLTKILAPEDFGVVSVAILILNFCQIIIEAGLTKTLIFKQERINEIANVVFWANLFLSIVVFISVFSFSHSIADYFNDDRVINVVRIYGALIIVSGISAVQSSLLQKDLNFKKLFWIKLLTTLTPGLFSVPLAFYGYGYWAILTGNIASQILQCTFLWKFSKWRPTYSFDFKILKELLPFTKWVLLESILYYSIAWGDSIIAGRFLGLKDLGVYTTGNNIVNIIFSLIFTPLFPIIFSSFSQVQHDLEKLKIYFVKIIKYLSAFSLPIGIGLFSINEYIEITIFNDKWASLGVVIGLIAIKDSIGYLISINSEVYRSIGKPDLNVKLSLLHLLFIPLYIYSAQFGLFWFCIARISTLITIPPHIFVVAKIFDFKKSFFWNSIKTNLFCSIVMLLVIEAFKLFLGENYSLTYLIVLIFVGGVSYISLTWLINKTLFKEIIDVTLQRSLIKKNV